MKQNINECILRTLSDAAGYPLLESVLRAQVESRLRPHPSKAALDDALDHLKQRAFIRVKANELDPDDCYWLLDELGEAFVSRMRL